MSALPPKADIGSTCQDVRFVPKADSCSAAIDRGLLGQVLTNLCQQFARAVGFRNITVATGRMRFAVVAAQGIGSDGDNRNVF